MKEDDNFELTASAQNESHQEIKTGRLEPLFNIGDSVVIQNDPDCFGSVIKRYFQNENWMYKIIGSGTNPNDIAESELARK